MDAAPQPAWQSSESREDSDGDLSARDPGFRIALETLRGVLRRRSRPQRFMSCELPPCTMSRLLWNAVGCAGRDPGGISRASSDGGIDVYVALASGLYRLDPLRMGLHPLSDVDIRCQFSIFDCLPAAPLNLVYVSRIVRRPHAAALAAIRAAALCEKVDRFCGIEGMAATVRRWLDRRSLLDSIGLEPAGQLVLVQSVGYAADADGDSPDMSGEPS